MLASFLELPFPCKSAAEVILGRLPAAGLDDWECIETVRNIGYRLHDDT